MTCIQVEGVEVVEVGVAVTGVALADTLDVAASAAIVMVIAEEVVMDLVAAVGVVAVASAVAVEETAEETATVGTTAGAFCQPAHM